MTSAVCRARAKADVVHYANFRKLPLRACKLGTEGMCKALEPVNTLVPLLDASCNVKDNEGPREPTSRPPQ